jgi:hypothetical protein
MENSTREEASFQQNIIFQLFFTSVFDLWDSYTPPRAITHKIA